MKKFLAVLLVLAMALSLCACAPLGDMLRGLSRRNNMEDAPAQVATMPVADATIAPTMPAEEIEPMPMPTEAPDNVPTQAANPEFVDDAAAMQIVNQILGASEITVDEAYNLAFSITSNCAEHLQLQGELASLKACQGLFYQHSESSSRTYKAEVVFYLKDGDYWFSIDYAGYSGTIRDGELERNEQGEFLFEGESTGSHTNLFTGELMVMDFYIQFGQERMYITWGSSEYYLERT